MAAARPRFCGLLRGELDTGRWRDRRADALRIVYFDQTRELGSECLTLRRALAPEGDSVIYQGPRHSCGVWAARFLFTSEQLNQPVGRLVRRRAGAGADRAS